MKITIIIITNDNVCMHFKLKVYSLMTRYEPNTMLVCAMPTRQMSSQNSGTAKHWREKEINFIAREKNENNTFFPYKKKIEIGKNLKITSIFNYECVRTKYSFELWEREGRKKKNWEFNTWIVQINDLFICVNCFVWVESERESKRVYTKVR